MGNLIKRRNMWIGHITKNNSWIVKLIERKLTKKSRGRPRKQLTKPMAEDVGARYYSKMKNVAWEIGSGGHKSTSTNHRIEKYRRRCNRLMPDSYFTEGSTIKNVHCTPTHFWWGKFFISVSWLTWSDCW